MSLQLPLSTELVHEFSRQHYLVMPAALPADLLPGWREKAIRLAIDARLISRKDGEFPLVYRVVTGETIREQWPELFALYNHPPVLEWIKAITGEKAIFTSQNLQSAVNVNIMDSTESVYRWHFDAVAYTALLYLGDLSEADGGALELVTTCDPHTPPQPDAAKVRLWPRAGTFLLMDGTRCYHRVAPLLRPAMRISIPFVYPNQQDEGERPAGLDSYLYQSVR